MDDFGFGIFVRFAFGVFVSGYPVDPECLYRIPDPGTKRSQIPDPGSKTSRIPDPDPHKRI
jgi:hypothetical protein